MPNTLLRISHPACVVACLSPDRACTALKHSAGRKARVSSDPRLPIHMDSYQSTLKAHAGRTRETPVGTGWASSHLEASRHLIPTGTEAMQSPNTPSTQVPEAVLVTA